jgi:ribose 5-phosphate isomerase B
LTYYVATDHAGIAEKEFVIGLLKNKGITVVDLGPSTADRVDYPDFAQKVVESVLSDKESFGVLICGSGIGMSIMANRYSGIRAALCHDAYTATVARGHNDANVLCIGARIVGLGVMESIVDAWVNGSFEGGRHGCRVEKLGAVGAL